MAEDQAQEQTGEEQVEEEELDLELESVAGRKRRGCGWGTVIAVLVIVAAVVVLWAAYVRTQEKRTEEREARQQSRIITLDRLSGELLKAAERVQDGDLQSGIEQLRGAKSAVDGLIREAETQGDEEDLYVLRSHSGELQRTLQEAEAQYEALRGLMGDQLPNLATRLSGGRVKPPASPTEEPDAPESPEPTEPPAAPRPAAPPGPAGAPPAPGAPGMVPAPMPPQAPMARPPGPPGPPGAPPPPPPPGR